MDRLLLVSDVSMNADRITAALARIDAALTRIDAVREVGESDASRSSGGSTRVVELVNVHEKLREQVAESLRELDDLLTRLEE